MTLDDQKCNFSEAWLQAVAAAAGFGVQPGTKPDDQSVDVSVSSKIQGLVTNPRLDVQLKATAVDSVAVTDFSFSLKQKNYDDLRDVKRAVPKILVVIQVPLDVDTWVNHQTGHMELLYRGWWMKLQGFPANDNEYTTTVTIPAAQVFTPSALRDIMNRISTQQW